MGASGASIVQTLAVVERGDPAAFDFTEADLTMDNAWHDLDVSGIIADANVKWVLVTMHIADAAKNKQLHLRKNGNSNEVAVVCIETLASSDPSHQNGWVPCDGNQVIEYKATAAISSVDIVVMGWSY